MRLMAEETAYLEAEELPEDRPGRAGDGGVYLVVADDTEEFQIALRYAARRAQTHRAHIGILQIINVEDFIHWGNIEARMRKELRDDAEKFVFNTARKVNELNGLIPCIYVSEGARNDMVVEAINEDMNIKALILAGGTQGSGPGPMVNYFTGKGLSRLRVPVVVVPGHLEPQKIDAVAR